MQNSMIGSEAARPSQAFALPFEILLIRLRSAMCITEAPSIAW
jgi:hypothetical protein